ncbi:MAG: heavy metal-associated domain-containing protein [Patescibacteria group bacterium]
MATVKKEFQIDGMHCGSCAIGIQMVLTATDGVTGANISYEAKSGEVEFDDTKINTESIEKAVSELGYKATPK